MRENTILYDIDKYNKKQNKVYVAIIGSRDVSDYNIIEDRLKNFFSGNFNKYVIISGGAKGVDSFVEKFANDNNIDMIIIKPNWKRYKKGAGIKRNKLIVELADIIIAFWNKISKGTKNTIDIATKQNKKLLVYYVN